MKNAAKSASDSTQKAAKKTQLKLNISNQQGHIESEKKKFGVAVWEAFVNDDDSAKTSLFEEHKAKVDDFQAKIDEYQKELAALEEPAAAPAAKDDD
eukprot:CAMPEP_0168593590 /NCGR_PEP_ID=MMETSP0420-20121227/8402_1 /TAXON_ID=498008 /ORGANISM="Pessonella sp." /LENGTH=96 /DNA_ID=CAMNT_0008629765 /DNA_START=55 /DNA_END=345 /DNA_ORIENTATION=-